MLAGPRQEESQERLTRHGWRQALEVAGQSMVHGDKSDRASKVRARKEAYFRRLFGAVEPSSGADFGSAIAC